MQAHIIIEKLSVDCIIGCLSHERTTPQLISIDVKLCVDVKRSVETDDVSDAVNYVDVANLLTKTAIDSKCHLLERLAWNCCDALFGTFVGLKTIELQVSKPAAIPAASNTAVSLCVHRDDWGS